ncbi:MAG: bacillithiol biosynthesis cysteine-adding enzyme BshC [Pedobacter sp.]|jgi:bacillithiol biosynthesis cysteine-adding enzyme BshC
MKVTYIDYSETRSFSENLIRYLNNDPELDSFKSCSPDLQGFSQLMASKKNNCNRRLLVEVLKEQYSKLPRASHAEVNKNTELLLQENTFTVCTGHQLNLFTGPLYFIFKIVTAINLARDLKSNFPDKNFVPVYWMATEDHDFAEINHTYISEKKISWELEAAGATGRLSTSGIEKTLKEYLGILGISENARNLGKLITDAYTENKNLADACRQLVNTLFEEYGLVILDADDRRLKKEFSGIMAEDITGQHSFRTIAGTNKKLAEKGIEAQVNPREINFFYLLDGLRERIVFEEDQYRVLNTTISFSKELLLKEISDYPERFSPNVVMRPVYQEVILPNLAYIGGGAEILYWLQLKQNFDHFQVDFPLLLLRNSAIIASINLETKLNRLDLSIKDIFKNPEELKKEWVFNHTEHCLNLNDEWQELGSIFEKLKLRTYKIDPSLAPSSEAVKARLHKAIKNLEVKLIKAEKRNFADALSQIDTIKAKLFPKGGLQERSENFGLFYVKHGRGFIKTLIKNFKPLDLKFTILEE